MHWLFEVLLHLTRYLSMPYATYALKITFLYLPSAKSFFD